MINEIIKYDREFNEAIFLSRVDHIFIMLLDSIMDNDLTNVKHYLSEETFNKYNSLIEDYKKENLVRLFDEMNVKSTEIKSFNIEENRININVLLISRYMDYFVDENGEFVRGENTHRIEKTHNIVFSKKLNASKLGEARRCTSCGNTLDINVSGKCPFCNQIIDMSAYDYIINKIDNI